MLKFEYDIFQVADVLLGAQLTFSVGYIFMCTYKDACGDIWSCPLANASPRTQDNTKSEPGLN